MMVCVWRMWHAGMHRHGPLGTTRQRFVLDRTTAGPDLRKSWKNTVQRIQSHTDQETILESILDIFGWVLRKSIDRASKWTCERAPLPRVLTAKSSVSWLVCWQAIGGAFGVIHSLHTDCRYINRGGIKW